jgi:superfamily II DNA or RNA helicase
VKSCLQTTRECLGLTGTLATSTRIVLEDRLALYVNAEYPLAKAIDEGIIVDYQITVVTTPLDIITKQNYGGKDKDREATV